VNHKARKEVETVIPTVLEQGGEYFLQLWKSLSDSASADFGVSAQSNAALQIAIAISSSV